MGRLRGSGQGEGTAGHRPESGQRAGAGAAWNGFSAGRSWSRVIVVVTALERDTDRRRRVPSAPVTDFLPARSTRGANAAVERQPDRVGYSGRFQPRPDADLQAPATQHVEAGHVLRARTAGWRRSLLTSEGTDPQRRRSRPRPFAGRDRSSCSIKLIGDDERGEAGSIRHGARSRRALRGSTHGLESRQKTERGQGFRPCAPMVAVWPISRVSPFWWYRVPRDHQARPLRHPRRHIRGDRVAGGDGRLLGRQRRGNRRWSARIVTRVGPALDEGQLTGSHGGRSVAVGLRGRRQPAGRRRRAARRWSSFTDRAP